MKKTGIIFLALLAAGGWGTSFAQDKLSLTLEDSLKLALRQNPFYQAEKAREDQASAMVKEAFANFLPSVNAQGTYVLDKKVMSILMPSLFGMPAQKIKLDFTRDYQLALTMSVPLYAGGRIMSGYKQANLNLQATREAIRQSMQDTVFNVKKAFYGYLLARQFADVAREAVDLSEKHLKNVKSLYEVGVASRFDLLRSEVQASNLKPQLIRARNGLNTAELGLKTLLGLDLKQPIEVKGELSYQAFEADMDANVSQALASRPELVQLNYQKQMAAEMVKMARAAYIPTLAVGGQYNYWGNNLKFTQDTWESYYSFNLVLNVPLFNGFVNSAKLGESKAMLKQLEFNQKGLTEMVKFEVHDSILSIQQAKESLLSQEKNVEQAQEAVRIAELNYKEGLATNLDVSGAHVALSQARTNHSQALFDYALALAQLEKAIGAGRDVSLDK
ncbi:MAG: TolC family protein [Candidatus Aminicenantes bacterium]|nr:TolC family protein [Candidatus Aminicenantes bacterium]